MLYLFPFKYVKSFADLSTGEVFINQSENSLSDIIKHEQAHLISKDKDHAESWKYVAKEFGLDEEPSELLKLGREKFGIPQYIAGNIGNISGIQNLLTDYWLLQAYRKFSQRLLGNEGQWEFKVEANTIRLFPVPKGSFPVVVEYLPSVTEFKSPQAREITYRSFLSRMKEALGHARRKFGGIPGPDGSTITFDGDALVTEGREEYEKAQQDAILLSEPLGPYLF